MDMSELGVHRRLVTKLGGENMKFAVLHHMALVVSEPAVVHICKIHKRAYEMTCSDCQARFLVVETDTGFAIGFGQELSLEPRKTRTGGSLLNLPELPGPLRSFICKESDRARIQRSAVSFEDLSQLQPREGEAREILAHDTDLDVMFGALIDQPYVIGSYEDNTSMLIANSHSPSSTTDFFSVL
jgi:hypothetical protein